jgi:hypothetical protein
MRSIATDPQLPTYARAQDLAILDAGKVASFQAFMHPHKMLNPNLQLSEAYATNAR